MGEGEPPPEGTEWLWRGGTFTTFGHGQIWFDGKLLLAHRVSWIVFHGEIPDDMIVRHKYDVPSDVNPNNLELGTYQDNMDDMCKRGRCHKGNPLSPEQKQAALAEYMTGRYTRKEIALKYGSSTTAISQLAQKAGYVRPDYRRK